MRLIAELATFGARADGGVNRQALTAADIEARVFLARHAQSLGCTVAFDAAGNMFFRRAGSEDGPPIATGSHIDSQPAGGKLDGAYGVCAGLEVIAAFNDARVTTRHSIEVVAWANEEGCRFAPGSLGSQAFVEPAMLPKLTAATDADGVAYSECIGAMRQRLTEIPERPLGATLKAFVETHIEQGPVLEKLDIPIGIVSAVQGVRWFRITALGAAAHAGTTPLECRRDALRAVIPLVDALYQLAERVPDLRVTVGKIDVAPASINTVPGAAAITVDVRHVDASHLNRCEALIDEYCAGARHGCDLTVERLMALPTTRFDDAVRRSLHAACEALQLGSVDIVSGAFHDAVYLARHCPTGMVFVPSRSGVSHNPAEDTDPELLTAGARVLALALMQQACPAR